MKKLLALGAALLLSATAVAHHSFAVFDFNTRIDFEGEVDTLQFRNPHIAMTLKTVDESGEEKIIHFIEGAPANMLVRSGLKKDDIKPGTNIKAVGSPLIENQEEFFLRRIILEDGREFE